MSRIAPPSEKIMAVSGVFRALSEELPPGLKMDDPVVQAALIDAATRIAMATDTRDMGIMVEPDLGIGDHFAIPCDDCGRTDGTHDLEVEH